MTDSRPEGFMNKVLFLVLTVVSLIILMYVSDYVSASYLLSDKYVPQENFAETQEDSFFENAMPLDEYKQKIKNGEDPGIESPEQMPIEIQLLQAKSFILRIFIFVLSIILSVFGAFVIKSRRVEFSYMAMDSSERAVNTTRIILYVVIAMTAYMMSQRYPFTYLLGWVSTVIWVINLLAIMIWVLNVIYAFKERRALSGKALKPLKPLRK